MKSKIARLGTAEHILVRILVNEYAAVPCTFQFIDDNTIEIDLGESFSINDSNNLEDKVNKIIDKNIEVKKYYVDNTIVVDIIGFDKKPCKYPHVYNTCEIGKFKIIKWNNKDGRFRLNFDVE